MYVYGSGVRLEFWFRLRRTCKFWRRLRTARLDAEGLGNFSAHQVGRRPLGLRPGQGLVVVGAPLVLQLPGDLALERLFVGGVVVKEAKPGSTAGRLLLTNEGHPAKIVLRRPRPARGLGGLLPRRPSGRRRCECRRRLLLGGHLARRCRWGPTGFCSTTVPSPSNLGGCLGPAGAFFTGGFAEGPPRKEMAQCGYG